MGGDQRSQYAPLKLTREGDRREAAGESGPNLPDLVVSEGFEQQNPSFPNRRSDFPQHQHNLRYSSCSDGS